jgi:ferritin-like protein
MSDSSHSYHERIEALSAETMDMHRALVSLQEELEAVDWYRQRADACGDKHLRAILAHNMREEIEHASMLLEWLRRSDTDFDEKLSNYLFAKGDILEAEEQAAAEHEDGSNGASATDPAAGSDARAQPRLTIGSLKEAK